MMDYEGCEFEQYILEELIGQGRFADVYKAKDSNLDRWVAIKVLREHSSETQLRNFLEEARITSSLRHPHIITVFALNYIQVRESERYISIPYLVMEYADDSLAEKYPHGNLLDMDTILWYFEQIVDALEYIHSQWSGGRQLVHRDIKPANLLIRTNNEILICDFGIARFARPTPLRVVPPFSGDWMGTVMYTAPERFDGQSSPAADQYALGIMLFEWLTGKYPFHGTKSEVKWQHIHTTPPSLRAISPDISPAIERVVLKMLHKDPCCRFQSVREMFYALEEAAHPSFPRSFISFIRRHF